MDRQGARMILFPGLFCFGDDFGIALKGVLVIDTSINFNTYKGQDMVMEILAHARQVYFGFDSEGLEFGLGSDTVEKEQPR